MSIPPLRLGTIKKSSLRQGGRPAFRIGNTVRPLPKLSAPVGPESLRARYPGLNAAADVALIDSAFQALAALRPDSARNGHGNLLAIAEAVRGYATDRVAAIAAFQRVEDIRDDQERAASGIKPDGLTWQTLFTYAELARELNALRDRKTSPIDYIHTGGFDLGVFRAEADRMFDARANPDAGRYNAGSIPDMLDLLGRCTRDPRVIDIRWIAYMLATALWETSGPTTVPNVSGRGTHQERRWARPNEEDGRGDLGLGREKKDYLLPVKVAKLTNGEVRLTEGDGDVFVVAADGTFRTGSPGARRGSAFKTGATEAYLRAEGTPKTYFGRGYCHVTWWDNYALTSVAIGLGLELLLHPEKALDPSIAFEVMVNGMVYGSGWAHGKRLQSYISGAKTDYVGARRIVNGTDQNIAIGRAAEAFEQCLMRARV